MWVMDASVPQNQDRMWRPAVICQTERRNMRCCQYATMPNIATQRLGIPVETNTMYT